MTDAMLRLEKVMVYTIEEIKLGLQYEPDNLDVNKVCFIK